MTSFEEAAAICDDVIGTLRWAADLVGKGACRGLLMATQEDAEHQLVDAGFTDLYAISVAQGLGWGADSLVNLERAD